MGLVLWIDRNELAMGLIEKVFKGKGLQFYGLKNALDFAYLIEDLRPSLIVLESATVLSNLVEFRNQYEQTQEFLGAPIIIVGQKNELAFLNNVVAELQLPIDPFKLPDTLNQYLQ
jgi:hypothetical protein